MSECIFWDEINIFYSIEHYFKVGKDYLYFMEEEI